MDTCCQKLMSLYSIDKVVTAEMSPTEIAERFGNNFFPLKKGQNRQVTFANATSVIMLKQIILKIQCTITTNTGTLTRYLRL